MIAAAYPAVKAARPDVKVLVGGTSSMGDHTGRGRRRRRAAALHPRAGVRRRAAAAADAPCAASRPCPGDGWTHHPYSLTVEPGRPSPDARDNARIGDLGRLTALLDRLAAHGRIAPAMRNVYLTEYGYESRFYRGRFGSRSRQAGFLTWAEYLSWRNPRVRTYAQFLLRDLPYAGPRERRCAGRWATGRAGCSSPTGVRSRRPTRSGPGCTPRSTASGPGCGAGPRDRAGRRRDDRAARRRTGRWRPRRSTGRSAAAPSSTGGDHRSSARSTGCASARRPRADELRRHRDALSRATRAAVGGWRGEQTAQPRAVEGGRCKGGLLLDLPEVLAAAPTGPWVLELEERRDERARAAGEGDGGGVGGELPRPRDRPARTAGRPSRSTNPPGRTSRSPARSSRSRTPCQERR